MNQTILIIDDDSKLNALLTDYLQGFGFRVRSATRPDEGLRVLQVERPDLVILDVMLPGMDGFQVCKSIRRESTVPIVMLTARGEVTDRIVGLELGADDYLPKPFEPRELVARIQSVLRRHAAAGRVEMIRSGRLSVDVGRRSVLLDGASVDLTTTEYEVLVLLARTPGKVLSRDVILEELRGIEWESCNRSVDVVVSRLRHKLGDDPKNPGLLKTVRNAGYVFIGQPGPENAAGGAEPGPSGDR